MPLIDQSERQDKGIDPLILGLKRLKDDKKAVETRIKNSERRIAIAMGRFKVVYGDKYRASKSTKTNGEPSIKLYTK
jgi:hypothetical protein